MFRHRQVEWVSSPYESRPNTYYFPYYGIKFRRWNRRSFASDLLILVWLGTFVVAALRLLG